MVTVTLAGPRGGTGKTTTAVNLAVELAASGRRVTLLDLDPDACATRALGYLPDSDPLTAEPIEVRLDADARGVLLLARGGRALTLASGYDVRVLMVALREHADVMIIDLPPGATALTAAAVEAADVLLTTLTPECSELADVRAAAQLPNVLCKADGDFRVVLARQATAAPAGLRDRFKESYPTALCRVEIPEDAAAQNAMRLGVPLRLYAPESDASRAYQRLARELAGEAHVAAFVAA